MKKTLLVSMVALSAALFATSAHAQAIPEPSFSVYSPIMYLTWPTNYGFTLNSEATAYVTLESTGSVIECSYYYWDLYAEGGGNVMELNIGRSNIIDGETYLITLAADQYTVTCDGEPIESEDLAYTWTYSTTPLSTKVTYSSEYADGTARYIISNGTPTIIDGSEAVLTRDGEEVATYTLTDMDNVVPDYSIRAYVITIAIPSEDINVNGNYTLTVPSTAYTALTYDPDTFEDIYLETVDMVCDFTVSTTGLNSIMSIGSDTVNVYSAAGVCVLRNATADQVNALPAGLYIINNQKVAIRK